MGANQNGSMRQTRQRKLVLEAVRSRCDHPTADDIYLGVREQDDKISRGTVYRNLAKLVDSNDILRVRVPGADRYDLIAKPHCHIMCKKCEKVYNIDLPYDDEADERVASKSGFVVDGHCTVFIGICPDCRENE